MKNKLGINDPNRAVPDGNGGVYGDANRQGVNVGDRVQIRLAKNTYDGETGTVVRGIARYGMARVRLDETGEAHDVHTSVLGPVPEEKPNPEACPGCGCLPGDGYTDGCNDEAGCGFFRSYGENVHAAIEEKKAR